MSSPCSQQQTWRLLLLVWLVSIASQTTHALTLSRPRLPSLRKRPSLSEKGLVLTSGSTVQSPLVPPPGSSYVPEGLTAAQYTQLKQQEALELSQKEFGALGPRFHRQFASHGWRQLWRNGIVDMKSTNTPKHHKDKDNNKKSSSNAPIRRRRWPGVVACMSLWTALALVLLRHWPVAGRLVVAQWIVAWPLRRVWLRHPQTTPRVLVGILATFLVLHKLVR